MLTQTEPKKQSLTLEQSFAGYVRQALILKPTEGNDKTSRNSNWGLGLCRWWLGFKFMAWGSRFMDFSSKKTTQKYCRIAKQ